MALKTYNIIVEQGVDGYLISSVIELPGCHTQAESLDELYKRTKEAIEVLTLHQPALFQQRYKFHHPGSGFFFNKSNV
jgi:predicted RNase H-like HicB family nuclease